MIIDHIHDVSKPFCTKMSRFLYYLKTFVFFYEICIDFFFLSLSEMELTCLLIYIYLGEYVSVTYFSSPFFSHRMLRIDI